MSESLRILVIEDDPSISEVVCAHLTRQGHCCVGAFSGTEGMLHLEHGGSSTPFDLVITDLMLPGMTGEEVVSLIRQRNVTLPIIVISARTAAADKVDLLQLGADDYLTKPFDLDELTARVQVQLRRAALASPNTTATAAHGNSASLASLSYRDWQLDPAARTFAIQEQAIALTRTEFAMLELLMAHPSRVFTKQELYEHAWNEPYAAQDGTVAAHISNLRAKLRPSGTDGYIETVWGIGFKLS